MSKKEFLDKLRVALNGKVSPSLVEENLTYYNEYIDSQILTGRSEQEVMEVLGDPRLIARTIVQTNGTSADSAEDAVYRENTAYDSESYSNNNYDNGYTGSSGNGSGYSGSAYYNDPKQEVKVRTIPGWVWVIVIIVIAVCVLGFVFSIISALLPLLLPILLVLFLVKLFRDWLN